MFLTSSTIRKRKDSGKWQVIIRQKQNGTWKQVESKTFTGSTEAKQWSTNKKAEWQTKVETDYDKMTIGQLKEIYLETKKKEVKHSTFITISSNIKNANWFDDETVYQITTHDIKNVCRNANYSHVKYMSIFYNFLIEELGFKIKNDFYKKKPTKESKTIILSYEDFKFIIDKCKNEDLVLAFSILYYTGIRISELNGLTWDSITNNEITISKQLYMKEPDFTSLKSENSNRTIPIHKELKTRIRKFKLSQKVVSIDKRLFKWKQLNIKLNDTLKVICQDTHLEGITCHDFRHTFITNLVQNKVDIITVAYLAGDNVKTIIDNYVHINKKTKDLSKQAVNLI